MTARRWRMFVAVLAIGASTAASGAAAQSPSASQSANDPETAALAQGWALLARGDAAGASVTASQLLGQNPRSVAALTLATDAEIRRAGPVAGLNVYERWVGSRSLDDAYVLRRIARALLAEQSQKTATAGVRIEALRALAADGDPAAVATLQQSATSATAPETRVLASFGDERAVRAMMAELGAMPGSKSAIISGLAETGSPLPIPALTALLADQNDINRSAAADALGRLNAKAAIPRLKPLLNDPVFTVRLAAARALHRLGDMSGVPFLQELSRSEHPAVRIGAVESFAGTSDPWWQRIVRDLATHPDPAIRIDVARLIAPYDQPLANQVLQGLLRDDNPAVREAAAETLARDVAADFATLRGLLRNSDPAVRVRAAARILSLTR